MVVVVLMAEMVEVIVLDVVVVVVAEACAKEQSKSKQAKLTSRGCCSAAFAGAIAYWSWCGDGVGSGGADPNTTHEGPCRVCCEGSERWWWWWWWCWRCC